MLTFTGMHKKKLPQVTKAFAAVIFFLLIFKKLFT